MCKNYFFQYVNDCIYMRLSNTGRIDRGGGTGIRGSGSLGRGSRESGRGGEFYKSLKGVRNVLNPNAKLAHKKLFRLFFFIH